MKRSESLQALRGLAALLVAVGHAFYFPHYNAHIALFEGKTLDQITGGFISPFPLYCYMPSGMYPVAVFFLLSGYVIEISLRRLTPTGFLIARAFRIYPAFFIIFAIYVIVYASLGHQLPPLRKVLSNFFLIDSFTVVEVSWTLLFEVRYYLAMAVLAMIGLNGPLRPLTIIAAYFVFGTGTGFWLGYMSIGALLYYAWGDEERGSFAPIALLVGTLAWYFGANSLHNWATGDQSKELAAALATFVIAVTMIPDKIIPRALTFLGDISYPLYCIHLIVITACFYLLAGKAPQFLVTVVPVVISIGLATIIHFKIERPGTMIGKRLAARWMIGRPTDDRSDRHRLTTLRFR
jgi:peptidoglycan/LPS O-acetylase OafA/YrhL